MLLGRRAEPAPPGRLDQLLLRFDLLLWFESELLCFGNRGELRLLLPGIEACLGFDRYRRYFRLGSQGRPVRGGGRRVRSAAGDPRLTVRRAPRRAPRDLLAQAAPHRLGSAPAPLRLRPARRLRLRLGSGSGSGSARSATSSSTATCSGSSASGSGSSSSGSASARRRPRRRASSTPQALPPARPRPPRPEARPPLRGRGRAPQRAPQTAGSRARARQPTRATGRPRARDP